MSSPNAERHVGPRRRIALCIEACNVCFEAWSTQVYGGEFITDQARVARIAHDPHFRVYEGTAAELDQVMADHAARIERLKREAAPMGLEMSPHGAWVPHRHRHAV